MNPAAAQRKKLLIQPVERLVSFRHPQLDYQFLVRHLQLFSKKLLNCIRYFRLENVEIDIE
jgi:hypothetical protein